MRSWQVFASMSPARAESLYAVLVEHAPAFGAQLLFATAAALKARPAYLRRQPLASQAAAVRRALSRFGANALAEEVLAVYFLECRKPLIVEWLDAAGVDHEDGTLKDEHPAQPDAKRVADAVERFRRGDDPENRELLLRAFAAQSAIQWPALDALLVAGG